jgi:hypothetical protein
MAEYVIPLAEPFTATERGRYEPAWRDGAWSMQPAEYDGYDLRPGDSVTAVRVTGPAPVIHRDEQQEPDGALLLGLPVRDNEAGAATIREYLAELARVAMDIKRLWGDSGWIYDLYAALESAGLLEIQRDEHGYIRGFDRERAAELIGAAIDALGEQG